MVDALWPTSRRLWKGSPAWRYSVMAAGLFTALSAYYLWTTPSGSSGRAPPSPPPSGERNPAAPPAPPAPPSVAGNPLSTYLAVWNSLKSTTDESVRCDALAGPFNNLTQKDQTDLRVAKRFDEVNGGISCARRVEQSDARLGRLSAAVTAAERTPTSVTVPEADAARAALTPFDLGCPSAGAPVGKAQAVLSASDARIADFRQAVDQFRQSPAHAPADYRRLEEAAQRASPDRGRMTSPAQKATLAAADAAMRELHDSGARLDRLAALAAQASAGGDARLAEAVAAITPLDDALATPPQKEALDHSRQSAAPWAWSQLEEREKTAGPDPSPADESAIAGLYRLLNSLNPSNMTGQQHQVLDRGKAAQERLAASDQRLQQLAAAAEAWRRDGPQGGDAPLAALRALTKFDSARFQAADRQAWEALTQADAVLHASERGLTAATKAILPICVTAADADPAKAKLVAAVRNRLQGAGFVLDCTNAALLSEVTGVSVDKPYRDSSVAYSQIPHLSAVAHLQANTRWAADGKPLFTEPGVTSKATGEENAQAYDVTTAAIAQLAAQFAGKFEAMAAK